MSRHDRRMQMNAARHSFQQMPFTRCRSKTVEPDLNIQIIKLVWSPNAVNNGRWWVDNACRAMVGKRMRDSRSHS